MLLLAEGQRLRLEIRHIGRGPVELELLPGQASTLELAEFEGALLLALALRCAEWLLGGMAPFFWQTQHGAHCGRGGKPALWPSSDCGEAAR